MKAYVGPVIFLRWIMAPLPKYEATPKESQPWEGLDSLLLLYEFEIFFTCSNMVYVYFKT